MSNIKLTKPGVYNRHIAIAYCTDCYDVMVSTGGGRFVKCKCDNSFIDQERFAAFYVRLGGKAAWVAQFCPKSCTEKDHKDNPRIPNPAV